MAIYELGNSSDDGGISLPIEISDVNQLETVLNNKALLVHRHTITDIDNLQTELTRIELIANGTTPPPPPPPPPSPVPTKGTVGPAGTITFNVGSEAPSGVNLDFLTLSQCANYIRDSDEINKRTSGYEHFDTIIIRACKLTEPPVGAATGGHYLYITGKALTTDTGLDLLNTTITVDGYEEYSGRHVISTYAIAISYAHTVNILDINAGGVATHSRSSIEIYGHSLTSKATVIIKNISNAGILYMRFSYVDLTVRGFNYLTKLQIWSSTVTNIGYLTFRPDGDDVVAAPCLTLSGSDMTTTSTGIVNMSAFGDVKDTVGILMEDSHQVTGCSYTGRLDIGLPAHYDSNTTGIVVTSNNATITGGTSFDSAIVIEALRGIVINATSCSITNVTIRNSATNGGYGYGIWAYNSFTGTNISMNGLFVPYKILRAGPGTSHFELYANVSDTGTISEYSMEITTANGDIYEPIVTGAPMSKPYLYS